jgi:hypothetical protein
MVHPHLDEACGPGREATPQSPVDPTQTTYAPAPPCPDYASTQSPESRDQFSDAKTEYASHIVSRVDSDDTLTQSATQRRKLFKDFRNPTDPTQYVIPEEFRRHQGPESPTVREYRRSRQRRRIMLNSSMRLLLTALLCGLCAVFLKKYQRKSDMSIDDSQWFNTLMTALPLFIGLNYRSSLQSYARVLRWWILARWDWKLRQFDLILDAASSKAIIKLFWESRRKARVYLPSITQIACLLWIVVNLTGAIGIALLGLTYQMEQSQGVLMRNGDVSILDVGNETFWAESAHYYASSAAPVLLFTWAVRNGRSDYDGLRGVGDDPESPATCVTCKTWNYTFQDWDPAADVRGHSERHISASADCKGYAILNTTTTSVVYKDAQNDTQSFDVPWTGRQWDANNTFWRTGVGATYVHDTASDCGPRCARMYIISTQNYNRAPVWLYNCTNTVSQISGTNLYSQHLSDASARSFAAASGHYRNSTNGEWATYQTYDWSQAWVLHDKRKLHANDEVFAAATLAQFSLTSIANADHVEETVSWLPTYIPARKALRKTVRGKKPYQALRLGVNWKYAIAIMCAVPGLQLLVLLTIVFFANDVVVKDESHLNTARLLFPVAERMSHRGSLLQVNEVIEKFGREDTRYRYGWEMSAGVLRVGVLKKLAGMVLGSKERQFPEGQYD